MPSSSDARWYAHRLASMSPAEMLHRVREQVRRLEDRGRRDSWGRFDVGDGPLTAISALRRAFERSWPAAVAATAATSASLLAEGELPLLGRKWPAERMRCWTPDLWFWDPVSRTALPGAERYTFDVARVAGGKAHARYVWELNRLQFLHPVAALAIRSGEREAALAAVRVVLSWMEANPPFRGVNWSSGIELALRLVSLAFVVAAAGDTIDAAARSRLRAMTAAHGFWLSRYPSLYSSANNHRLAEGLGLLLAGALAPDLPQASGWTAEGRRILIGTGAELFHPDGIGVEQSPTYAAFALEMLALGSILDPNVLTSEIRQRLTSAAVALKAMLDDGGNVPRIGDDDEGRVIAMPPDREPRYVSSILAALSGLLGAPELAPPSRAPHLRDLLFGSPDLGATAPEGVRHFRNGGYTVVRERVGKHRAMMVFDWGPLGFFPLAAHGHADALAVWLHADDMPVVIDAGTGDYSSASGWRELFRSTNTHNTVTVGNESQSLTAGPFNWRHKATARLTAFSDGPSWMITARHDGYEKRFGVVHERTVRRVEDGFAIEDRLIGAKIDTIAASRLLIHPAFTATLDDPHTVVIEGARSVKLRLSFDGGSVALETSALHSHAFGERSSATAVVVRFLEGRASTVTVRFV